MKPLPNEEPGCKSYLILVDASTKTILARNYSFRPQTLIKPQIMREALREAHGPNLRAKREENFWPPPRASPTAAAWMKSRNAKRASPLALISYLTAALLTAPV